MSKRTQPTATATVAPESTATATVEKVSPVESALTAIVAAVAAADETTTTESITATVHAAVRTLNTANRGRLTVALVGSPVMASPLAAVVLPAVTSAPTGRDPREQHLATFAAVTAEYAAAVALMNLAGLPTDGIPTGETFAAALAAVEKRFAGRGSGERPGPTGGPRSLAELAAISPVISLRSDPTTTATVAADSVTVSRGKKVIGTAASLTAATQLARGNNAPVNGWVEWRTASGELAGSAVDAARTA